MPQATVDAVLADWRTAHVPERTRTALALLEQGTLRPAELDAAFLAPLAEQGLESFAMREAAVVGYQFAFINRVADAFDFSVPTGRAKARLARLLNFAGRFAIVRYADPSWVRGADGLLRPVEVEHARERLLTADGVTSPDLRRAAEAFTARLRGGRRPVVTGPTAPDNLPPELEPYLRKLALHAYQILDRDVESLRNCGYSDEVLYELTFAGALGAAVVALESLFGALYGPEAGLGTER